MRYVEIDGLPPVSKVGLGTNKFGAKGLDRATAGLLVRRALELGITHFDTAEIYNRGRSEQVLGWALGERRDEVVVTTKLGTPVPTPATAAKHARASRERLGVRRISLYLQHFPTPVVNDRTLLDGLRALQDDGVVSRIGVSNYGLDRWRRADNGPDRPVVVNQVGFSLVNRKPVAEMVPWAAAGGRIVVAHSPLAQGMLAGRYDEHRKPDGVRALFPAFLPENLRRAQPLLTAMRDIAASRDITLGQLALAWLLHFEPVVVIPGASTVAQLEANVEAAEITLSEREHRELTLAAEQYQPLRGPRVVGEMARQLVRA